MARERGFGEGLTGQGKHFGVRRGHTRSHHALPDINATNDKMEVDLPSESCAVFMLVLSSYNSTSCPQDQGIAYANISSAIAEEETAPTLMKDEAFEKCCLLINHSPYA